MHRFLTYLFLVLISSPAVADSVLTIEDAWVREGPPTAKVLAGFMVIKNASDKDIELTHVESEDFDTVEMHRTVIEDGMANMLKQDSFIIPAKGQLVLEPGSYHLMLIGAKRALQAGDAVTVKLSGEAGYCLEQTLTVRKGGADAMQDHHHHHH